MLHCGLILKLVEKNSFLGIISLLLFIYDNHCIWVNFIDKNVTIMSLKKYITHVRRCQRQMNEISIGFFFVHVTVGDEKMGRI